MFRLFNSGTAGYTDWHGVALALRANASLLDLAPFSSKLAKVYLKGETANIAVIAVYVPAPDGDDLDEDNLCAQPVTSWSYQTPETE